MKNIFQKFCKQRPFSICEECGVHFEPAALGEQRWGHLCSIHRRPVMEHDRMLDSVASWAKQNWQLIKPMMIAAQKDEQERYNRLNSAGLGALGRGAAFSSQYKP